MLRILLVCVVVLIGNGLPPEQPWFLHVAMVFASRMFAFAPGVSFVSRLLLSAPSNEFCLIRTNVCSCRYIESESTRTHTRERRVGGVGGGRERVEMSQHFFVTLITGSGARAVPSRGTLIMAAESNAFRVFWLCLYVDAIRAAIAAGLAWA